MKKAKLKETLAKEITDPWVAQLLWAIGKDCWYPLAGAAMSGRKRDARYTLLMEAPYNMLVIMHGIGLIDLGADNALTERGHEVALACARLVSIVGLSRRDERRARHYLLEIGSTLDLGVAFDLDVRTSSLREGPGSVS